MGNELASKPKPLDPATKEVVQHYIVEIIRLTAERDAATATRDVTLAELAGASVEVQRLRTNLDWEAGIYKTLAGKFESLVEENKRLTKIGVDLHSDLSACTARYNEAVLDGVRKRAALAPFAEACDDLTDDHRDSDHIWEAPAAMNITTGHLRAAHAAISAGHGEG